MGVRDNATVCPGDAADYVRGKNAVPCEVLGFTPQRTKIVYRRPDTSFCVANVKADRLRKRAGGGAASLLGGRSAR